MRRKIVALLVIVMIMQSLAVGFAKDQNEASVSTEVASNVEESAEQLNKLGLLSGTGNGYALDQPLTRAQAITFIIKLKGAQAEALSITDSNGGFTDVEEGQWYTPYVQYCKRNNLVAGFPDGSFKPNALISERAFLTLMLKTLGYSEQDFTWDTVYEKADQVGLHIRNNAESYTGDQAYHRSDVVRTITGALPLPEKERDQSLIQSLIEKEQVTEKAVQEVYGSVPPAVSTGEAASDRKTDLLQPETKDELKTEINRAKALGRHAVEVIFNEEIQPLTSEQVKIIDASGKSYKAVISSEMTRYIKVKTDRDLSESAHTIRIADVKDMSGHMTDKLESELEAYDTALDKQVPIYIPPTNSDKKDNDGEDKATEEDEQEEPEVESGVTFDRAFAMKANTIWVWFNEAFDETSALDPETYSLVDQDGEELEVIGAQIPNTMGYVVSLTTEPQKAKQYTLTGRNIKQAKENASSREPTSSTISFTGVTQVGFGPSVQKVTMLSAYACRLTYDMKLDPAIAKDTNSYHVTDGFRDLGIRPYRVDLSDNQKEVTLVFDKPFSQTEHMMIDPQDISDLAGNVYQYPIIYNTRHEYSVDQQLDIRQVRTHNLREIIVECSEQPDEALATDQSLYRLEVTGSDAAQHTVVSSKLQNETEIVLTLDNPLETSSAYTLTISGLRGRYGKPCGRDGKQVFEFTTQDQIYAQVESVEAVNPFILAFTFTQELHGTINKKAVALYDARSSLPANENTYPFRWAQDAWIDGNQLFVQFNEDVSKSRLLKYRILPDHGMVNAYNVPVLGDADKALGSHDTFVATYPDNLDQGLRIVHAYAINNQQVKVFFNKVVKDVEREQFELLGDTGSENLHGVTPDKARAIYYDRTVVLTLNDKMGMDENYSIKLKKTIADDESDLDQAYDTAHFVSSTEDPESIRVESVQVNTANMIDITFTGRIADTVSPGAFTLYTREGDIQKNSTKLAVSRGANADFEFDHSLLLSEPLESKTTYYMNIAQDHKMKSVDGLDLIQIDDRDGMAEISFTTPAFDRPELSVDAVGYMNENTIMIFFTQSIDTFDFDPQADIQITYKGKAVVAGKEFKSHYKVQENTLTLYFEDDDEKMRDFEPHSFEVINPTKIRYKDDTTVTLDAFNCEGTFLNKAEENKPPRMDAALHLDNGQIRVMLSEGIDAETFDVADLVLVNTYTNEPIPHEAIDFAQAYDDGGRTREAQTAFLLRIQEGAMVSGTEYEVYFSHTSDATDVAAIQGVLKDLNDDDKHEGAVTFTAR